MYVERTFIVPRPIEAVFDYLADFTHTEQWDPGTVSTTRVSGDGGLGTTYRNVSQFMGRQVELDYETVEHDRPHRLRFAGKHPKAESADDMTFTRAADGSGTEIHYRADFRFSPLINLVAPLVVKPRLQKLADETVDRIRTTLLNLAV